MILNTYFFKIVFKTIAFELVESHNPTYNNLSKRPGLNNAGSSKSGLLVAPTINKVWEAKSKNNDKFLIW